MSLPTAQERLSSFRKKLTEHNIDCFIQSTNDAHQSEYVTNRDKRLGYLSCFTGSAGTIVVSKDEALLWTDGRYFVQAEKELSKEWKLMKYGLKETPSIHSWIKKNIKGKIGVDPYLTSISKYEQLKEELSDDHQIVFVKTNPIDQIWGKNQPIISSQNKIFLHDIKYSGLSTKDKLKCIRNEHISKQNNCYALIVPSLDHIAWLFNLRGNDIIYNPVFMSYAIITLDNAYLYLDKKKLSFNDSDGDNDKVKKADTEEKSDSNEKETLEKYFDKKLLKSNLEDITICNYEDFIKDLKKMVESNKDKTFWIDKSKCNMAIYNTIDKKQRLEKDDPIELLKSVKNKTEINGMTQCHIRDGAAKTKFFAWINELIKKGGEDELKKYNEYTFGEKLKSFREKQDLFIDLSFETISSVGENGAIIHYAPQKNNNKVIKGNEMYLLDSGAQYLDGTTDVTRTQFLSVNNTKPSDHQIECYTRVLKGVINLTLAVFPENTKGPLIDALARMALWKIGLDYQHGTGHGVGCCLNVHEGPQGFSASSYRRSLYTYGLVENMIITNEPGYYETGNFGIRIENVMQVVKVKTKHNFNKQEFCTFKTLTMVPLDLKLIDVGLLSDIEIDWINNYHKQVGDTLLPYMKQDYEIKYLKQATLPITRK